MKLDTLALPEQNKVMHAYTNDLNFLHTYFDYDHKKENSFPMRLEELTTRTYNRKGVAATVRSFMEPFGISASALKHIAELEENAVTVIGGQQAGILTGPLFSIHKAITVILLAKNQRARLGVPVVPIFWVAGEDHDLNEINHVYTETDGRVSKEQIQDKFVFKLMASDAQFDQELMSGFIKNIFSKFGETAHTKSLLIEVLDAVKQEDTFTGFFVRLMNGLFADEGLLFIDSAYGPLRELESDYFCTLIEKSDAIASSIFGTEQQFEQDGYGKPLNVPEDASHLFYVHETGRVLLTKRSGDFVNDSAGLRFSKLELLKIAKTTPSLLSNNVATRPLMQDLVFPVLAFVGGPGEISYWALLKKAFHQFDIKMPVVVPRMSLTLIPRATGKTLKENSFNFQDVMQGKVATAREQFINELHDNQFESMVNHAEKMLIEEYEKISHRISEDETMMHEVVQKNLEFHKSQFEYLKRKAEDSLLIKHEVALRTFNRMETDLFPNGSFQERIYTPYMFMNEYGRTLVKDLLTLPFEIDGKHKIIYL